MLLGEVVVKYKLNANEKTDQIIDLSNYPNGMYFMKINTNESSTTYRIVKK